MVVRRRSSYVAALAFSAVASAACSSDPAASPGPSDRDGGGYTGGSDVTPDAGTGPSVRFVGRFDRRDASGPRLAWPGTRIVARFEGTEVRVRLTEQSRTFGPSRYEVLIDGKASVAPLTLAQGPAEYSLARDLKPGPHTVELYRLTEAQVGTTQFLGFDFPGGKLLSAPPPLARRIEFLGDSTSNGYGIDGTAPCSFSSATQNERRAYPSLVAAALEAEHINLGYSGKGVFQNYARDGMATGRVVQKYSGGTFHGDELTEPASLLSTLR